MVENTPVPEGSFVREKSGFREFISKDHPTFQPEVGRYHLYISWACPWANRCALVRHLKGLQNCIGLSVTHPVFKNYQASWGEDVDWCFGENGQPLQSPGGFGSFVFDDLIPDPNENANLIGELYRIAQDTKGWYTVPVLWDKKLRTIVNNESSEIVVMLNSAFDEFAENPSLNLIPEDLKP